MNTRFKTLLVLAAALSLSAAPVFAQGRGGGSGRVSGGMGAGMGASPMGGANVGGNSGLNGRFGGQSDTHINAQERANTNGPNAMDRDFGSDRASDRTDLRSSRTGTTAQTSAANDLGGLNAVHASDNARANASSGSRVGEIATYQTQMKSALAISDPTQRNAAIARARQQLAQNSNKPLTANAITKLDSDLNIQGASPTLGAAK